MCGIAGFLNYKDELAEREEVLKSMMDAIRHRGPDGDGTFLDADMSMGFVRLSIIDLEGGDQPIFNEDKTKVITFNGEIYNYKELKSDLENKGHIFSSKSDTEVILHGFEEYGKDILKKLRGMFAFVIWDIKDKSLFAARDMFGIKPFYYYPLDKGMIYASEIKAILKHPAVSKEVNLRALEEYMSFQYSVLPETFFKGIFKLMPGHYMTIKEGKMTVLRYFDPMLCPKEDKSFEEFANDIEKTVKESIKYHMVSDVEVASLLSSGVDSSYVVANFGGSKTFTVGFDYEKYNEIPYAQELSKAVGIENISTIISTDEFWGELSNIQYYMDEPLADPAAAALYFVDREAAKHVKVVLSGEGADEFFGGYNIYHEPLSLKGYQKIPKPLRKVAAGISAVIPKGVKGKNFLVRGSKSVEERFIGNAYIFTKKQRDKVLKYKSKGSKPEYITKGFYNKVKDLDDISKMQYIDLNFWLIGDILLKADKMSMAHSLESRVPYLDREVFELAKTLPSKFKVSDENTKLAFRKAAARDLASKVSTKKKLGFPVPIRIWLKSDKYYEIVKKAFESKEAEKFFNTKELIKLLDEHKLGKADYSRHIWNVYMFLIWYERFFEDY
ncbi:MAG: asparagine synthase (glutamine-hydrolyzing) [Parasporobacterium sp.]|nr:asparagine synthase (glutamine-hydrolyzing) [Parasporobacterium sp.]